MRSIVTREMTFVEQQDDTMPVVTGGGVDLPVVDLTFAIQ